MPADTFGGAISLFSIKEPELGKKKARASLKADRMASEYQHAIKDFGSSPRSFRGIKKTGEELVLSQKR